MVSVNKVKSKNSRILSKNSLKEPMLLVRFRPQTVMKQSFEPPRKKAGGSQITDMQSDTGTAAARGRKRGQIRWQGKCLPEKTLSEQAELWARGVSDPLSSSASLHAS